MNERVWVAMGLVFGMAFLGCVDARKCADGCVDGSVCDPSTNLCVAAPAPSSDAGEFDAGDTTDSGVPDAGADDAGAGDAGSGDAGSGDAGSGVCHVPCSALDECVAGTCTPRYEAIAVSAPTRVNAPFQVSAALVSGAGRTPNPPATLDIRITQTGTPDILTALVGDGGTWSGTVPVSRSGTISMHVTAGDGGLSGSATSTVDLDAPHFEVLWSSPPVRATIDGGPTYKDPGAPAGTPVWRRDEVAQMTVRSLDSDVDQGTATIRVGDLVVQHDGGCLLAGCSLAVDLSRPSFPRWRGTIPVAIDGSDDLGNSASRDGGGVYVTRHFWTRPVEYLGARSYGVFLSLDPGGSVHYSRNQPVPGVVTLNLDGTERSFIPTYATIASVPAPVRGQDGGTAGFFVVTSTGVGSYALQRLSQVGPAETVSLQGQIADELPLTVVRPGDWVGAAVHTDVEARVLWFNPLTQERDEIVLPTPASTPASAWGFTIASANNLGNSVVFTSRRADTSFDFASMTATVSNAETNPYSRAWHPFDAGVSSVLRAGGQFQLTTRAATIAEDIALDGGIAMPFAFRGNELWYGGQQLCRVARGGPTVCLPASPQFLSTASAVMASGEKLLLGTTTLGSPTADFTQLDARTMTIDWSEPAGPGVLWLVGHIRCHGRRLGQIVGLGHGESLASAIVDQPGIDSTFDWATPAHDPLNTGNRATSLSPWTCP